MMENSVEKLKLLSYEDRYCKRLNKPRVSRFAFAIPAENPALQLAEFLDLCARLVQEVNRMPLCDVLCCVIALFDSACLIRCAGQVTHGHERLQFSEFDDPHTSVNKLMLALRGLDFALSIPATRLKTAHGEAACSVLEFLVDAALKESGFKWQTPSYADTNDVEQAADDSSADLGEIEEDLAQSDAEEVLFNEIAQMDPHESSLEHSQRNIIEASAIDAEVWKKELERVAPRLRVTQPRLLSSSNEWRAHIEQTQTNRQTVAGLVNNTNGDLQIIS
jgi:hypothetical protein